MALGDLRRLLDGGGLQRAQTAPAKVANFDTFEGHDGAIVPLEVRVGGLLPPQGQAHLTHRIVHQGQLALLHHLAGLLLRDDLRHLGGTAHNGDHVNGGVHLGVCDRTDLREVVVLLLDADVVRSRLDSTVHAKGQLVLVLDGRILSVLHQLQRAAGEGVDFAFLEHREELLTCVLEESGADLTTLVVEQVNTEQRTLALGVGPPPNVRLGRNTSFDCPSKEREYAQNTQRISREDI